MNTAKIELKAYAKINLGLDVIRRLETGYHEVSMVMQTIDLYDRLILEKREKGLTLEIKDSDLPMGEENLVYRAAKLMMDTHHISEGLHITLYKKIPIAAGMAGGSSDAAATMKGINTLFQLNLELEQLQKLGVTLGADIPYCLLGGTALAEGIGEILTTLISPPQAYLVIAKPDIMVSTAYVYQNLQLDEKTEHPDIKGMIQAIEKQHLQGVIATMGNVLESVTIPRYPLIEEIKDCMKEQGALNALMSGSGPTVFGIFTEEDEAKKAYQVIRDKKLATEVYQTIWKEKQDES